MKAEYRAKMCVDALKDLTTEQIEELKVWLKSESTTLMFDYVSKNRLLEAENLKLQAELKQAKDELESLYENQAGPDL